MAELMSDNDSSMDTNTEKLLKDYESKLPSEVNTETRMYLDKRGTDAANRFRLVWSQL